MIVAPGFGALDWMIMALPASSDHVAELVRRLQCNRAWISQRRTTHSLRASEPPYEFSHTLSVMILMLALTERRRQPDSKRVRYAIDKAVREGWPSISRNYRKGGVADAFTCWFDQVNQIRHALAHGNVKLWGSSEIEAVELWTTRGKVWRAKVSSADLGLMSEFLSKHLTSQRKKA
jgi:hypothetical protein